MDIRRDAPAIVVHRDAIIPMDGGLDVLAISTQGLIMLLSTTS